MKFCYKCGAEYPEGEVAFCGECGTKAPSDDDASDNKKSKKAPADSDTKPARKRSVALWVLWSVAGLLIAGNLFQGLYFGVFDEGGSRPESTTSTADSATTESTTESTAHSTTTESTTDSFTWIDETTTTESTAHSTTTATDPAPTDEPPDVLLGEDDFSREVRLQVGDRVRIELPAEVGDKVVSVEWKYEPILIEKRDSGTTETSGYITECWLELEALAEGQATVRTTYERSNGTVLTVWVVYLFVGE